jgi:thioredoxin 1
MSKIIETEKELDDLLKANNELFILFYASWCPYSQFFLPIYEKHASGKAKSCLRIMTDEVEACEDRYSINVVPTVLYFKDGKPVKRLDGTPGKGLTEKQLIDMMKSCGI